ncbi:hypothetical protein, partial [Dialister succinatiphilus]|uniref:hypothetical protein n=1 Tax=Dialister succinatiphilus TaxID=487173 RepID=UPI004028456B
MKKRFPNPHSRLSAIGCPLTAPDSQFPSPHSRLSAIGYQLSAVSFPIPDSRFASWLFKSFEKNSKQIRKAVSGQLVPTSA